VIEEMEVDHEYTCESNHSNLVHVSEVNIEPNLPSTSSKVYYSLKFINLLIKCTYLLSV